MFMSRSKLERERQQKTIEILQLLIVSGAVRPANVYIRYRGQDSWLGTVSSESHLFRSEAMANHRSMRSSSIRELWQTYRLGSAQLAVQMTRHLAPHRHASPELKAGTSGNH